MPKVRVYEIAKQIGIKNKELVSKIQQMGISISNHMSTLTSDEVAKVKMALQKERQANTVEKRLGSTVIRRRSKAKKPTVVPEKPKVEEKPQQKGEEATTPIIPKEPEPAAEETKPEEETASVDTAPATESVHKPSSQVTKEEESVSATEKPQTAASEKASAEIVIDEPEAAIESTPKAGKPYKTEKQKPSTEEVNADSHTDEASQADKPVPATKDKEVSVEPHTGKTEPATEKPVKTKPKEEKEEKLGPTGRRIELPQMKSSPKSSPKVVITNLTDPSRHSRRIYTPKRSERAMPFGKGAKGKKRSAKKAKQTLITTPAEHKRRIRMETAISVSELAKQMGIKSGEALKHLWAMGITGVTINTTLDVDTATLLASEFGFDVENVAFQEEDLIQVVKDKQEELVERSPVVTVMGHVDHGKTSLLDKIRDTTVASSEAGGITQHIGAYKVQTSSGEIVFIDTPGHEAFTNMRARGAQCTDIVILVVAADDGVMPQTKEAIEHSKEAGVPIVVAINKIDKPDADTSRVRQELTAHEIVAEEWGGDTLMVEVSAITGKGIDQLLETILLQAEILELQANPNKPARGVVLEALLDKSRGPMSTLLVQEGTIETGSIVVAGEYYGNVRAMMDHKSNVLKQAGPSTPVRILGLDGVPNSGDNFYVLTDEKKARRIVDHRREESRKKELAESSSSALRLDRIAEMIKEGTQHELKVVLKADVQGTSEALKDSIIKQSTDKVKTSVISSGVGGITETDVTFAKASGAIVVGFNVRPAGKASQVAEQEQVEIRIYNVIYELLDDLKEVMRGLLPKDRLEKKTGQLEVRDTFSIPKVGTIAGCFVTEGKVTRSSNVRLFRDNVQVYTGKIGSLKRFKDDVREVDKGYECGLSFEKYNDIKVGDIIEVFEIEEKAAEL